VNTLVQIDMSHICSANSPPIKKRLGAEARVERRSPCSNLFGGALGKPFGTSALCLLWNNIAPAIQ
jgi:hypothetical protein